jgi:uncharacterized membrane protein YozB (DUF420 family)
MRKVKTGIIWLGSVILFILGLALAFNTFSYFNFDTHYGFLRLKETAIATGWYLPAYYSHVLLAGIVLLIGFFQLYSPLGLRWKSVHRMLGKFYVFGILLFSAPGGLIMSLFINRGPWVLLSFICQCVLWFLCTYMAFVRIRQHNILGHRQWMLRSFALTLAAITLRVYVFLSSWSVDLTLPTAYATIAWLSWVPNLLLVEIYLRKVSRPELISFKK